MSDALLTDAEIERLTRPRTQGAARCRYLEREYGLKVKRAPNGQPVVARVEWDAVMVSRRGAKARADPAPGEPDWQALRNAGGRKLRVV